jgi:hypothetical protein
MDFPLADLTDEDACFAKLVALLHPGGLACHRCGEQDRLGVHRRPRTPVLDHQCGGCHRVFNAWTGTALQGVQRRPSQIVLILRGIAHGVPTAQLARELSCDRRHLLDLRHRLQERARIRFLCRWSHNNHYIYIYIILSRLCSRRVFGHFSATNFT